MANNSYLSEEYQNKYKTSNNKTNINNEERIDPMFWEKKRKNGLNKNKENKKYK